MEKCVTALIACHCMHCVHPAPPPSTNLPYLNVTSPNTICSQALPQNGTAISMLFNALHFQNFVFPGSSLISFKRADITFESRH